MKTLLLPASILLATLGAQAQNVGIGTIAPTDQLHTTGTVRLQNYSTNTTAGLRLMQMDTSGRLVVSGGGAVFTNATVTPIPDNGCGSNSAATAAVVVSGQPTTVPSSKIAVRLNISHTFDGDLKIYLISPQGQVLCLTADNSGSGANFTNTTFSDAGIAPLTFGGAPYTGIYKPQGGAPAPACISGAFINNFATFNFGSINPNGTWTLRVFDAAAVDVGTLNNWSISFSGPESFNTAEQASYIPYFSAAGGLLSSPLYKAANGNLGIGTDNPQQKLDIFKGRLRFSGDPSAGIVQGIEFTNSTGSALNGFIGRYNDSMMGFYGYTGAGWQLLFNNTKGSLGLQGNSNPRAPLSFANIIGNKIALWGNADGGHYGMGIQGSLLQLYSSDASADIAFGWGSSNAFTENMRVKGNGDVGIGIAPTERFHIDGGNMRLGSAAWTTAGDRVLRFGDGSNTVSIGEADAEDRMVFRAGSYVFKSSGGSPATVGLGTSAAATERLEVNGSIKMTDGNQAAGKVMTSNAAGKGNWVLPVSGSGAFHASYSSSSGPLNNLLLADNNSAAVDFDEDNLYNNTTQKYTAPADGLYTFSYSVYFVTFSPIASSGVIELAVYKNSVAVSNNVSGYSSGSYVAETLSGTVSIKLNAGDQVSLAASASSSSVQFAPPAPAGNYFSGYRVR